MSGVPQLKLALAVTLYLTVGSCTQAQQPPPISPATDAATVTFYSNHFGMLAGLGVKGTQAFQGHIFADHRLLSYIGSGSFSSFTLSSGVHDLSVGPWSSQSENHGAHLVLYLAPGEHYFIQLRTIVHPTDFVYHVGPLFGIDSKTCSQAFAENSTDKPVDPKHLTQQGAAIALTETSFPACPSPQSPATAP